MIHGSWARKIDRPEILRAGAAMGSHPMAGNDGGRAAAVGEGSGGEAAFGGATRKTPEFPKFRCLP